MLISNGLNLNLSISLIWDYMIFFKLNYNHNQIIFFNKYDEAIN